MQSNLPETRRQPAQPSFAKVAERLYRNEPARIYYAFAKRRGKLFRRSLKTDDEQLAKRRLAEFREKIACLAIPAQR
jgi:hypothetical protein